MNLSGFKVGDRALICARDDFYSYVDGWRGNVTGFDAGCVVVKGPGMVSAGVQGIAGDVPDVLFYVPADQLVHTV